MAETCFCCQSVSDRKSNNPYRHLPISQQWLDLPSLAFFHTPTRHGYRQGPAIVRKLVMEFQRLFFPKSSGFLWRVGGTAIPLDVLPHAAFDGGLLAIARSRRWKVFMRRSWVVGCDMAHIHTHYLAFAVMESQLPRSVRKLRWTFLSGVGHAGGRAGMQGGFGRGSRPCEEDRVATPARTQVSWCSKSRKILALGFVF